MDSGYPKTNRTDWPATPAVSYLRFGPAKRSVGLEAPERAALRPWQMTPLGRTVGDGPATVLLEGK